MALGEEGAHEFSVPFVIIELDGRMRTMHEVLLKMAPVLGEAAAKQVLPSDGLLGVDEGVVFLGVVGKFV